MQDSVYPNFATGFALNAGESLYPSLWMGLVGLWSPEMGLQGEKLRDWSNHGHHATLTGFAFSGATSNYVPGKFGYALDFDGTNDLADAGNIYEIDSASTQTMSVMFWVRSSTSQTLATLLTYDNNSSLSPGTDWYIIFNTSIRLGGFCNDSEIDTGISQTVLTDGKWHHVAVISRQTSVEFYIDGTLRTNNTGLTHSSKNFSSAFSLQWSPVENVGRFIGSFGETRLYNRDLTPDEVRASYYGATPLTLVPPIQGSNANVTVEPTVIDVVSSVLSPVVSIDITVTPSVIDFSSSVLSPDFVGNSTIVTVSEIDIVSSVESPSFVIDATITPTVLDITSSVESPIIPQDIIVTPTVITVSSSVETVNAHEVLTTASYGTRILSINPLLFATDTSPARIVKVDTTDPENLTWEVEYVTGVDNIVDATIAETFEPPQTTGDTSPASGVNNTDIGTLAWTSPTNILSSNDVRASNTLSGLSITNYLYASDFGFSIPTNAEILGITVKIERRRSGGTLGEARDTAVRLVKNGVIQGQNKALTITNYPTTEAVASYGSDSDLWQLVWDSSNINDTNFGVVLAVIGSTASTNRIAEVDHITIDISYRLAFSQFIYVTGADGLVCKIEIADLNNQTIIDTLDTEDLLYAESFDEQGLRFASTEHSTGELYLIDERETEVMDSDFNVLSLKLDFFDSDFACTEGQIMDSDFNVLSLNTMMMECDFKCLTNVLDDIVPIKRTEFVVFIDNVQLDDIDVNLSSINITHTIDEKSTASFILNRRHDKMNYDLLNNFRQITNQNIVRIEIQGVVEFEGKISTLNCAFNDSENITVTAKQVTPAYNYSNKTLSLPSLDKRLGLYDVLVNNPQIYNEYIDPNEVNPKKYKGIKVNLGQKITQSVSRYTQGDGVPINGIYIDAKGIERQTQIGSFARKIQDGSFLFKQNWTYFWSPTVFKPRFFALNVGGTTLANNIPEKPTNSPFHSIQLPIFTLPKFEFPSAENMLTGDTTLIHFNYIGTSLSPVSSDIWVLEFANHRYQRINDDIIEELGEYTVGSAPFKEISVRNGILVSKRRWVDEPNGLYSILDANYNYIEYAKRVAELEYQKIQNINGDILPEVSCSLEMTLDAYYYFNLQLLNRINIDNTTEVDIYKNNNGFPLGIKSININSGSMRLTITADNLKSTVELETIDGQFPDENSDEYTRSEDRLLVALKEDMASRILVE